MAGDADCTSLERVVGDEGDEELVAVAGDRVCGDHGAGLVVEPIRAPWGPCVGPLHECVGHLRVQRSHRSAVVGCAISRAQGAGAVVPRCARACSRVHRHLVEHSYCRCDRFGQLERRASKQLGTIATGVHGRSRAGGSRRSGDHGRGAAAGGMDGMAASSQRDSCGRCRIGLPHRRTRRVRVGNRHRGPPFTRWCSPKRCRSGACVSGVQKRRGCRRTSPR